MIRRLLFSFALLAAPALAAPDACLECHDGGKTPFTGAQYAKSVHGKVACTECHRRPAGSFDEVPHKKTEPDLTRCTACHGLNLKEFKVELRSGVHKDLDCGECHDAHTMLREREAQESEARSKAANSACLRCHVDVNFGGAAKGHGWLPNLDRHGRMRCMVCHAPLPAELSHEIVPKARATRSCEACHAPNSGLVAKYVGPDDRTSWVTNPLLFERAYVPGAVRHRLADRIILGLFALTVLGALGHGLVRMVARALRPEPPYEVASFDLYARGLRLWHWANALLVLALAATGMRMHFGGREAPLLTFEDAFNVHNMAGVALVALSVVFYVRAFATKDVKQYLGRPQDGIAGLFRQVGFYLLGIFRGADHPYHASKERRFNPLQQVTYAGVMYGLLPILLVTGVLLLFPDVIPERIGGRPGVWWFATAHYLSASAIVVFLLGHLYLATTGDRVRYLFLAMIDGRHRHHVRMAAGSRGSLR